MKYNISDSKTKSLLDELGEEYKDLLIEKLLYEYKVADIDSIPITELIKLDVNVKEKLTVNPRSERKARLYIMFSSIGIIYSLLGILLLFMKNLNYSLSDNPLDMLSLLLVIFGVIITLMAYIMKNKVVTREYKPNSLSKQTIQYEIINTWKELEGLMIQLTPEEKTNSPSKLIRYLSESNIISTEEVEQIQILLKLRNQFVHNSIKNEVILDNKEFTTLIKEIKRIISKLNNLL